MSVAIVDYGSGNLHSAAKAFERASARSSARLCLSRSPAIRPRSRRGLAALVLPGVGAFASAAWSTEIDGIIEALNETVLQRGSLAVVCVGMQLMAERGANIR